MSDLSADLETVARFGADDGGVTRLAWTAEHREAYDWLARELRGLGLDVELDPAGNLIGRWEAGSGRAVVVGSHLETVRRGGRYDGTLGVLAGLDAIRRLRAWGVAPRRPLWLAAWMDEEGQRFGTALMGSRAFCGEDLADAGDRVDRDGVTLAAAMAAWDRDVASAGRARRVDEVAAYLEMHIEQGPVLERAGVRLGVVSAIVGLIGYRARLVGEANHAGTTPMDARRDALAGAARAVLALREAARGAPGMTANVGVISAEPGGTNVVPGACEFTVDVRAPEARGLDALDALVRRILEAIAGEERLALELQETYRLPAAPMDEGLMAVLERGADAEGATRMRMPSGAGHDAQVLARHVPAAMLFVPSRGGVSHSPREHTSAADCELGARVMAHALSDLVT